MTKFSKIILSQQNDQIHVLKDIPVLKLMIFYMEIRMIYQFYFNF